MNPVSRITSEGRAEFLRTWGPGFDKEKGVYNVLAILIVPLNATTFYVENAHRTLVFREHIHAEEKRATAGSPTPETVSPAQRGWRHVLYTWQGTHEAIP